MAEDCKGAFVYDTCIPSNSCSYIMQIPRHHRCTFVYDVDDCRDEDALFWYMQSIACHFNSVDGEMYLGLSLAILLGGVYFMFLSYASDFFTPSLCYISNALGLSESLAGATLLAMGNSAPDIFTSLVGAMKLGFYQTLSQMVGSGMFLSTVVVATVILIQPFRVWTVPFLRNHLMYVVALCLLFGVFLRGSVNVGIAVAFLALYVIYIVMCILTQVREKRNTIRHLVEKVVEEEDRAKHLRIVHKDSLTPEDISHLQETEQLSLEGWVEKPRTTDMLQLKRRETTPILHRQRINWDPEVLSQFSHHGVEFPTRIVSRDSRGTSLIGIANASLEVERAELLREFGQKERARRSTTLNATVVLVEVWGQPMSRKHHTLIRDFIRHMNPVDVDEWQEMNFYMRCFTAILAPMVLFCKFLIPCVDESIVCNNWCKLLFVLQCIYLPPMLSWALGLHHSFSFDIYMPVMICVTLFGIMAAVGVHLSSHVNEAPPYHMMVAVFGFLVSITFIYLVAGELISILVSIAQILSVSTVTMAFTVVAWGNGVGDFVNGISLARAGFPRMAYNGVFGSNILNVLVGVGIFLLVTVSKSHMGAETRLKREHASLIADCFFLLLVVCGSSLLIVPTLNFYARRSFALFLIAVYFMFIPFCILDELTLISSFILPYHFGK